MKKVGFLQMLKSLIPSTKPQEIVLPVEKKKKQVLATKIQKGMTVFGHTVTGVEHARRYNSSIVRLHFNGARQAAVLFHNQSVQIG